MGSRQHQLGVQSQQRRCRDHSQTIMLAETLGAWTMREACQSDNIETHWKLSDEHVSDFIERTDPQRSSPEEEKARYDTELAVTPAWALPSRSYPTIRWRGRFSDSSPTDRFRSHTTPTSNLGISRNRIECSAKPSDQFILKSSGSDMISEQTSQSTAPEGTDAVTKQSPTMLSAARRGSLQVRLTFPSEGILATFPERRFDHERLDPRRGPRPLMRMRSTCRQTNLRLRR